MMASFLSIFFLFSSLFCTSYGAFLEELTNTIQMPRKEKTTHLHFYFHDILTSQNPSAVLVAGLPNVSSTGFGNVVIMDDALTEGPEPTSKVVGKAQGLYALSSQDYISLLMVLNFAFVEGKFNGSSISVLGRNSIFDDVREMPIVGGSGYFRFARGYAHAHTIWLDMEIKNALVEYNMYISHY